MPKAASVRLGSTIGFLVLVCLAYYLAGRLFHAQSYVRTLIACFGGGLAVYLGRRIGMRWDR
jgi:threonine/homoserine/homoserine lactone efflux protein